MEDQTKFPLAGKPRRQKATVAVCGPPEERLPHLGSAEYRTTHFAVLLNFLQATVSGGDKVSLSIAQSVSPLQDGLSR